MSLMLGIIYAHAFHRFQKCSSVNIQPVKDGLKIGVLFFWLGIKKNMTVNRTLSNRYCRRHLTCDLLILQHADFIIVPLLIEGGGEGERGGEGREVGRGACRL